MRDEVLRLREQYQFFHWHLAFPEVFRIPTENERSENEQAGWSGGFDVVLGNPPWERIKLQEKEWFASRRPDIANAANAAQRRRMISNLMREDPILYTAFLEEQRQAEGESHLVGNSNRYPLCGIGDINTYAIFAETMRLILGPTGRLGCIVPSGIATDNTTKSFFSDLMSSHSLVSLFSFENEAMLFPQVMHSVKFALLTVAGSSIYLDRADFSFGLRYVDDLKTEDRHFTLTTTDIAMFNPNTLTCPVFRSKHDVELTRAIYNRVPVLIKEGPPEENPWKISFVRMFDVTNDSNLFHSRKELENDGWLLDGNIFCKDDRTYLPLYEAKMIWHYNHRFGTHEWSGSKEPTHNKLPELDDKQLELPNIYPMPKAWVQSIDVNKVCSRVPRWFFCFRVIGSANVYRTFVGAIIPGMAVANSLAIIDSSRASALEYLCLQANLCSFIEDYVLRQNIGGPNLNFFIVKQIPFLPPLSYSVPCPWSYEETLSDWISKRALELTYTAWDLEDFAEDCGYYGPPFRWSKERRFQIQCELDAAYFHLYGVDRNDVDYIMNTFRTMKTRDEQKYGDYRTKRVILEMYDKMKQAMDAGEPYQTTLQPPPADPSLAHTRRMGMKA